MKTEAEAAVRQVLDKMDREDAFHLLVKLVAEYGWLAGRSAEGVAPMVRSACYREELFHADSDKEK